MAGSAVCDRDTDFQGNESDIEILSNPSQSSIEVLDSHHSSRKHSEERRVFPIIGDTPVDPNPTVSRDMSAQAGPSTESAEVASTASGGLSLRGGGVVKSKSEAKSESTQTNKQKTKNNKVTALKTAPLTESSSSGSVTDSICTAYEQNPAGEENGDKSNAEKSGEKNGDKNGDRGADTNKKAKALPTSKSEVSVIGSMFNQLLQFGNKSPKVEASEPDASFEPYRYSYDDFSSVDHRLKLFLYQNIFDDEAELKWLVRGRIYDESSTEPSLPGFSGLFVISTTKFYVLKAEKEENDDPSTWLKPSGIFGTVHRIITVRVLPFKVGITFTIKGIGNVHLLLHCILRTGSLVHHIAG